MPTWFGAACVLLVGLAVGSFMTVVATRVPVGEGIVRGRSHCDHCDYELRWFDNIPVLSWILVGGKCRSCRTGIGVLYPAMEVATAALWLAVWWRYGLTWTAALLAVFAAASVALTVIDVIHHRLPHAVVRTTAILVVVLALAVWITGEQGPWWRALAGAGILGGFYGVLWVVYPKGMGFGDVTTATLGGGVLGLLGWTPLMVGAIAGPLLGGVIVAVGLAAKRTSWGKAIPYGPALLGGVWVGILAGEAIGAAYLGMLGL